MRTPDRHTTETFDKPHRQIAKALARQPVHPSKVAHAKGTPKNDRLKPTPKTDKHLTAEHERHQRMVAAILKKA